MRSCLVLALACCTATAAFRPTSSAFGPRMCSPRAGAPLAQQYGYNQQPGQQWTGKVVPSHGGAQQYVQGQPQLAQPFSYGEQQQMYVQVLYEFQGQQAGDLALRPGDIVQVLQQAEPGGWWEGSLRGHVGWFPSNYCSEPYYSRSSPAEQPGYQQPAYQQPAYQQPAYQQPAFQQPSYQQPAYQQPAYQQTQQQGQGGYSPRNSGSLYGQTQLAPSPSPSQQHNVYDPRSTTQTYEQYLAYRAAQGQGLARAN